MHGHELPLERCPATKTAVERALLRSSDSSPTAKPPVGRGYSAIFITLVDSLTGRVVTDCCDIAASFHLAYPNGLVIVDATQAVGKLAAEAKRKTLVEECGADVFIFSGHKFGSLDGVGGIILHADLLSRWQPLIPGAQQDGLRGGTINVHGLLSMDAALTSALDHLSDRVEKTRACILSIRQLLLSSASASRFTILSPDEGGWTGTVLLLSSPLCSRAMANELRKRGYSIGIGTACKTDDSNSADTTTSSADSPSTFLLRISFEPGQTIDPASFVRALIDSYHAILASLPAAAL